MPGRSPKKAKAKPLPEVLADRVRAHRERLGWTQDDLAQQMVLLGFNWNRVTVAEVEGKGRGRRVAIEELLALVMIFGVGVVHLLSTGPADESDTQVSERIVLGPAQLQALFTIGSGRTAPPELRRMQLEFRRQQARDFLERAEARQGEVLTSIAAARKDLEDVEAGLAELESEGEVGE